MGFKTLKEYAKNEQLLKKVHLVFKIFKCNAITAELFENQTVKGHPQCRSDFTNNIKLNRILKQQTKENEEISTEITVELQQEKPSDIRIPS